MKQSSLRSVLQFSIVIALIGMFTTSAMGQANPAYMPYWDSTHTASVTTYAGTGASGVCTTTVVSTTPTTPVFGSCPGDGGPATAADLSSPQAVTMDGAGNLYIADRNGLVRRVDAATGNISLYAGGLSKASTGSSTCPGTLTNTSGDGCPANQAYLNGVRGIAIAPVSVVHNAGATCQGGVDTGCIDLNAGDIVIADASASNLRLIRASDYTIITLVKGSSPYGDGAIGSTGTGNTHNPNGMAFDKFGHLYFTESPSSGAGNRVRMVNFQTNQLVTVAGGPTGTAGCSPDNITPSTSSFLTKTTDVSVDKDGNVYVADNGCNRVRKITPNASGYVDGTGTISIVAGNGTASGGVSGYQLATSAIITPTAVKALPDGNLLIGDSGHVWYYDSNTKYIHDIYNVAGGGPGGTMAMDPWGNVYWGANGGSSPALKVFKASLGTNFATAGVGLGQIHFAPGDGWGSINLSNAPHFTLTQNVCGAANADNTLDCSVNTSYALSSADTVYESATITSTLGKTSTVWFTNQAFPLCVMPTLNDQFVNMSGSSATFALASVPGTCNGDILGQNVSPTATYTLVTPPQHGTVTNLGPNPTYTPTGSPQADSFQYKITDPTFYTTQTVNYTSGGQNLSAVTPQVTSQDSNVGTVYITPVNNLAPVITSPTAGSTLTGGSATFQWTSVPGTALYWIWVGTTRGGMELYNQGQSLNTSATISGLPMNGSTVYVRIFAGANGGWQYNDYVYVSAKSVKASMASPANGSTLTGTSATFTWTRGVGVTSCWMWVGYTPGSMDIYNQGQGTGTSATVNNLPTNGQNIYVRLFSWVNSQWEWNDYTYTAASPTPAAMISPANGSTLPGSTVTFTWTPGIAAVDYYLWVGSMQGGASDTDPARYNYVHQDMGLTTTLTATTLPTDGSTVYARLFTWVNGAWQWNDYTYTAASR